MAPARSCNCSSRTGNVRIMHPLDEQIMCSTIGSAGFLFSMDLPTTSELSIYVNSLSLLFNVYKSTKPSVVAKLDEIIKELRGLNPARAQSQTRAELDKKLEEKLLPEVGSAETEAVKRDLDLVAVFSEPIRVEDFDYQSVLSAYGSKYAVLADRAFLFNLRGVVEQNESLLLLPTAAPCLFNAEESSGFLCASSYILTPIKVLAVDAVLKKSGAECGLTFLVSGTFKYVRTMMGYSSGQEDLQCLYVLQHGGRKNWIDLEPLAPVQGFRGVSKRLDAEEVLRFMRALRSDVMKYVSELREETALIKGDISSLLQEVTQFFEEAKTH